MKFLRILAFILLAATIPSAAEDTYTAGKIVFNHPGPYSQPSLKRLPQSYPDHRSKRMTLERQHNGWSTLGTLST